MTCVVFGCGWGRRGELGERREEGSAVGFLGASRGFVDVVGLIAAICSYSISRITPSPPWSLNESAQAIDLPRHNIRLLSERWKGGRMAIVALLPYESPLCIFSLSVLAVEAGEGGFIWRCAVWWEGDQGGGKGAAVKMDS